MTDIIAKITTRGPRSSLDRILTLPLALDIWETQPDHVVLRASEQHLDLLTQMNYEVEQIETTNRFLITHDALRVRDATAAAVTGYHSYESLTQEMRDLAARAPEIVELHRIGSSVEGRTIWGLRLGDRSGATRKVLLMGCHHAREWISVEVPFLTASHIVANASDPTVRAWLTQGEVWVVPMVNPDGHVFTMAAPDEQHRLWRKNRRPNPDGSVGVDPNRNYSFMWGALDISTSSRKPSDETYIGPNAFSEPETRAVRDLVAREGFHGLLTYHSYSQLILHPWGHTHDPIVDAEDRELLRGLSERMRLKIRGVHGASYTAKQSSGLYPTAGDTTDWAYWTHRIPALTIELRPKTVFEGGFILTPDQIRPTWEENWPAAVEFINAALLEPAPAFTRARAATAGATSRHYRLQFEPQIKELSMKLMSYADGAADAPVNGKRLLNGDELQPVPPPMSFERPQFGIQLEEVRAFIRLQEAHQTFSVTGAGLAAAVIDTGVRKSHDDFDRGARVPVERNFTAEHGGDPTNAADTQGHGTHVAGIIAANGTHRGVAPAAKIVPLKVLDAGGGGSFDQILAALEWVRDNHAQYGITVACMSLGGRVNYTSDDEFANSDFRSVLRTLRDERVAVTISAGNDFFTHGSRQGMSFPAIIRECISVGAVYDTAGPGVTYQSGARAFRMVRGALTPFSQRLHESVNPACRTTIFAPGAPVTSTGHLSDTGETIQSGTSQAAPVTAGVVLLMQEYYRRVTGELPEVSLLVDCLRNGGVRLRDGDDEDDNVENTNHDFPGINAYSALEAVRKSLEVHLLLGGASFVS